MTEDISSILVESAMLLLVGMSVVFVFLTMLIAAIILIEKICAKFPDEPEENTFTPAPVAAPTPSSDGLNPQVVAAITAAVHQHRKQQ